MPTARKCPHCEFETEDAKIRFCPEHGAPLGAAVVWYDAFISYRRKDCSAHAQLIRGALQSARGMNVFVDVNELKSGVFDEALLGKIEAAPNFILILSEGSLDRCQNEGDWLRQEIVHALKHGRHIIPVLLNGATMPKAETLPADMRDLTRWNAVRYDDTFPDDALRRIGEWCKVERCSPKGASASCVIQGERRLAQSLPAPTTKAETKASFLDEIIGSIKWFLAVVFVVIFGACVVGWVQLLRGALK